jgi:3-oxoacyl-ACP reductase-like protein
LEGSPGRSLTSELIKEENKVIDPGLKDKIALITGGNNPFGIGAAVARAFASHGAKVFIHYQPLLIVKNRR